MGASEQARRFTRRMGITGASLAVIAMGALAIAPAAFAQGYGNTPSAGRYSQHNLVSDQPGMADVTDPDLVNAWGLAFGPDTPGWVSDAETGVSTLYQGDVMGTPVMKVPLTVTIPGGAPTGTVFNDSNSFVVKAGGQNAPANFLFSSESGRISAWSLNVPPPNQARTMDKVKGAIFKGLAIADTKKGPRLYATDFHHGKVDVWDGDFDRVHRHRAFRDRKIPDRFAPFGIETVKNHIVVTYAKQDKNAEDDVPGRGKGFVDIFSKRGKLLDRFASRHRLNAPWGIAKAPQGFGGASGDLLIGNFGNGWINAYKPKTGRYAGTLSGTDGLPLAIDGLWALKFGNGVIGTPDTLLFTAGPDDETHGLFGALTPAQ
jgi:uncharacterized protein (TIGR03118 family)